jgi:hypothetical protein
MKAKVEVDAGVCGFRASGVVVSDDEQLITFEVSSDCEKIRNLLVLMGKAQPIDAYQEISPEGESAVMKTARSALRGCCAGCVVPVGLYKAMQVAAGLALPMEIHVSVNRA